MSDTDRRALWKQGLFMLLFLAAFALAHTLLNLIAIVQFLWLLFSGAPNAFLIKFGKSLSIWLGAASRFLSCADDAMPFPMQEWPESK